MLDDLVAFYTDRIGMSLWLEQPDCRILKYGNMLLGFCQRESIENQGMITFVYGSREEVDRMYRNIQQISIDTPSENQKYGIYQFFAKDPEGRILEFQFFLHEALPI